MIRVCLDECCEDDALIGSDYCERHQNIGRGEQHEPFDSELHRLRSKLSRIEAKVVRNALGQAGDAETLAEIREEILK